MEAAEDLKDSLESFARSCNENAKLREMNREWNRVIYIHATDLGADYTLITSQGSVDFKEGKPPEAEMVVKATAEVLTEVFYGEVSPNEPFNEGTLRVDGTEADILRLDFITAMLWG